VAAKWDAAAVKKAAAAAKRLKDQTLAPGSVAAGTKMLNLKRLQAEDAGFGAGSRIDFQGVGPGGADILLGRA
jgi:hypothetical protein